MTESRDAAQAVLASPMRQQIVQLIRQAEQPLTAAQLAVALGLHVTTVRFHLEQLAQAGLVVGVKEPARGRGRPRIGYRAGAMDTAQVREQMIDALADELADPGSPDPPLEAGRKWAARMAVPDPDVIASVTEAFTVLGFAPEAVEQGVRLRQCPFIESAQRHPAVVCRVHLGLAQGIAARAAGSAEPPAIDLIPFEGSEGCLLTVEPVRQGSVEGDRGDE